MKLENGDQFERDNAVWIRQNLPTYEPLWSEFIGNNGKAHPLDLKNLPKEKILKRRQFYQAHYSMAQSAKRVFELLNKIDDAILDSKTENSYDAQFDLLFDLLSRIGHVRDMIGKMDSALGMSGSAVNPLQVFYDQRSHVTHGPQMPFSVKDDMIYIPKIGGRNPEATEWDDSKAWEEMNSSTFVPLSTFCEETVRNFFRLVVSTHEKIYSASKVEYKSCELDSPPDLSQLRDERFGLRNVEFNTMPPLSAYDISEKYWG